MQPRRASQLSPAGLWDGMATAMMKDLGRLFFLVAPFTLLPAVAIELLGPPPVATLSEMSGQQLVIRLLLPSLIGAIGQLAATHLVLRLDQTPRDALAAAIIVYPVYVLVQLVASLPVALGLLLLLVPGIWLFARLLFLSGAVVLFEPATPARLLQRCWTLSAENGLPLTLFLVLGLFGLIGIGLMAEGAGAGLDVVARFAGAPEIGHFLHALLPGIANCFVTIGVGAASAVAYRQLVATSA